MSISAAARARSISMTKTPRRRFRLSEAVERSPSVRILRTLNSASGSASFRASRAISVWRRARRLPRVPTMKVRFADMSEVEGWIRKVGGLFVAGVGPITRTPRFLRGVASFRLASFSALRMTRWVWLARAANSFAKTRRTGCGRSALRIRGGQGRGGCRGADDEGAVGGHNFSRRGGGRGAGRRIAPGELPCRGLYRSRSSGGRSGCRAFS